VRRLAAESDQPIDELRVDAALAVLLELETERPAAAAREIFDDALVRERATALDRVGDAVAQAPARGQVERHAAAYLVDVLGVRVLAEPVARAEVLEEERDPARPPVAGVERDPGRFQRISASPSSKWPASGSKSAWNPRSS
jgi:hypothetical protein